VSAPLRVLLIDDEPLARLRLGTLLRECADPAAEVVGEAGDAASALSWLDRNACDLVLLDIQMPATSGTDLAARLRQRPDAPAVVFVTAHAEHALQAFELDAVDYLTKPVRRDRLQAALQRVAQRMAQRRPAEPGDASAIVVTDRGRLRRVPVADVLYLKAELKYVTLRTAEHTFVLDDALSDLEQRLGERFVRVHRNALVARHAMRALERRVDADEGGETWAVQVAPGGEWLAVSRRQLGAVRDAIAGARV
jgi:two-component system, LytTR family, response regulator AlgR